MRLINTKVHALLDYLLGIILVFFPWVFSFAPEGPKYTVPVAVGMIAVVLALVTKFEYGAWRVLPLRVHLIIDVISGIALALSPWILGFREIVFKPHLVFGLTHAVLAVLTDRVLYDKVKDIKTRGGLDV